MNSLHRTLLLCSLLLLLPGRLLAEDLALGMSAAFSGPSRGLGIELYRGAMAYLEHINRAGGVHGKKIVMKAYDDGYHPIPAIQNTIKLIAEDHVFVLFGYVGTPTVTRVLPLLKSYGDQSVYLLFPFTGAQPHCQPPYQAYVFNLRASYQEETAGLVDQFLSVGRKRIGVFYQADAYGRSGWDGVRRALAKHGGLKIVAEATYRRGTPYSQRLNEQVGILKNAAPDAVIAIGSYAACAAFIRDARDAGWRIPVANVSFVGSESLAALLLESGRATGAVLGRRTSCQRQEYLLS
jgi:branched-chain amino acid transport system substrate-binding protein